MVDVLLIVKRGQTSGGCEPNSFSSGLRNSSQFVVEMLNAQGIPTALEIAIDGNSIDALVHKNKPQVVILEAIWCPPYKLRELVGLYPHIQWIVLVHSEIPFLAMEGNAIAWLKDYENIERVTIGANSDRTVEDLGIVLDGCEVLWLPNYYAGVGSRGTAVHSSFNVGCFGAIRPFKNQLTQAVAAISYAQQKGKSLCFHVNGTRCEQGGQQVLKNLEALFAGTDYLLVEHGWMKHGEFVELLSQMDLSMAVSCSESFNIVTADAVSCGVPVVTSRDIRWVNPNLHADTSSVDDIVEKMGKALGGRRNHYVSSNIRRLKEFNHESEQQWKRTIKRLLEG